MISFDLRRSSLRLAALGLLAATVATSALAQIKQYVHPHVLERDGSIFAIGWDLTGGQEYYELATDANGQTVVARRWHVKEALFSAYDNGPLFKILNEAMHGNDVEWGHAIGSLEKGMDLDEIIEAPLITSIRFPGGDVNSKDPAGVEVGWEAGAKWMRELHVKTKSAARLAAKRQKLWNPSNFRLTIGDLPCSKVTKTGSFHTTTPGHKYIDTLRTASDWVIDDWWFTLPASDAAAFRLGPLRETMAGTPKELPLRMQYLDEDGNTILTIETTCIVLGVDKTNPFDPDSPLDSANADKSTEVRVRPRMSNLKVFYQQ